MIGNIVKTLCREFRYDRIRTLSRKHPVLQSINIETAYACNMQCRSCGRRKNARLKFMEFSLFAKIISELKDMHYRGPIGLHYAGEPLLHPEFAQIAEYVAMSGFSQQVFMYTNGLLLDRAHLEIMKRNKIKTLNVSIDGSKEYVSAFRAQNSYERIMENLRLIHRDFPGAFDLTIHITLFQQDMASINELMHDIRP